MKRAALIAEALFAGAQARKFSAVLGTTSGRSSITMRPELLAVGRDVEIHSGQFLIVGRVKQRRSEGQNDDGKQNKLLARNHDPLRRV